MINTIQRKQDALVTKTMGRYDAKLPKNSSSAHPSLLPISLRILEDDIAVSQKYEELIQAVLHYRTEDSAAVTVGVKASIPPASSLSKGQATARRMSMLFASENPKPGPCADFADLIELRQSLRLVESDTIYTICQQTFESITVKLNGLQAACASLVSNDTELQTLDGQRDIKAPVQTRFVCYEFTGWCRLVDAIVLFIEDWMRKQLESPHSYNDLDSVKQIAEKTLVLIQQKLVSLANDDYDHQAHLEFISHFNDYLILQLLSFCNSSIDHKFYAEPVDYLMGRFTGDNSPSRIFCKTLRQIHKKASASFNAIRMGNDPNVSKDLADFFHIELHAHYDMISELFKSRYETDDDQAAPESVAPRQ